MRFNSDVFFFWVLLGFFILLSALATLAYAAPNGDNVILYFRPATPPNGDNVILYFNQVYAQGQPEIEENCTFSMSTTKTGVSYGCTVLSVSNSSTLILDNTQVRITDKVQVDIGSKIELKSGSKLEVLI